MSSPPTSTASVLASEDLATRPLPDLTHQLPNIEDLPDDPSALQDLLRFSHAALLSRNTAITTLHSQLQHTTTSHDDVVNRSAEWKDELESLKAQVPTLQHQLMQTRAEKEELEDRVKDLRMRAEESRRAIMRLQGEQQQSRTKKTEANRRSTIFGATHESNEPTEDDPALTRQNKRSTILFGAASHRASRHVRTASGGTIELPQDGSTSSTGYRGLRLGDRSPRLQDGFDDTSSNSAIAATLATLSSPTSSSRPVSSTLAPPGTSTNNGSIHAPRSFNLSSSPSASAVSSSSAGGGLASPLLDEDGLRLSPRWHESHLYESEDSAAPPSSRPTTMTAASASSAGRVMQIVRQKDQELERLQSEMRQMRIRLDEAIDAKKASDDCLKALKEFIGEGGPEGEQEARQALRGLKLPPLPTSEDDQEEEQDDGNKTVSESTWASKWTNTFKPRAKNSPADGGIAQTDVASTSPEGGSTLGAAATATAANGLASIGSFFARTAAAPPTPSKSPTPAEGSSLHHRPSVSSATGSSSDGISGSGQPSSASVTSASAASTSPAMNRLSTWFKRAPSTAAVPTSTTAGISPSSVASPPFASLEQSTLHPVDLDKTVSVNSRATPSPSPIEPVTAAAAATGVIVEPLGTRDANVAVVPSSSSIMADGLNISPQQPVPISKDVPPNARAAKAMAKSSDVSEDGATLEGGGFVPPAFD